MKKKRFQKVTAAFLTVIMVFLMMPTSIISVFAVENDYSVPTTEHNLLSSYNALSGTDISTTGAASSLDIFNRNKIDELIKNYASYDERHAQFGEERKGNTMFAFTNSAGFSISPSVGVNVGVDKLFKIAADKKFNLSADISYSEALETYFYEYVITVQKGYYNFNQVHLDKIRDFSNGYLTEEFINALTGNDGTSAEEFFNTYGTHIITSYTAGGTAGVYSSTVKTTSSKDVSVEAMYSQSIDASGSVNDISIGGKSALELKAKVKGESDESNCETVSDTYAHGGNDSICFKGDGTFDYVNWVNSIDSSNAVILIDERLKMVPIWTLMPTIGNEERILELTSYFINTSEQQDSDFYSHFGIDKSSFDYSKDWLNFENCKIITNEKELNNVRNDLNGVYVLGNNITLSDYANWTPIGTKDNPFRGRFYGNYNTISGLNIFVENSADPQENSCLGLFGYNDGLITDLKIGGNIAVSSVNSTNVYVGAVAAYNDGIISNCFDDVTYDMDYSIDPFSLPISSQLLVSNKTYYINEDSGLCLTGQASTTYYNVNIVIEESQNTGPVYIVLEDVNIVGSSTDATIYNKTSRPLYILCYGTSNSVGATNNTTAVKSLSSTVHILGVSTLSINGGSGSTGWNGGEGARGGDGGAGGSGIIANKVYANISVLNVTGGNGGNGGHGGGNVYGYGGNGGNGGYGGTAIVCSEIVIYSDSVLLIGGNGGNGGNGGDDTSWTGRVDGNGGNGGSGGGAISTEANRRIVSSKVLLIGGGLGYGGSGQDNGAWGAAGTAFSPKAEVYSQDKRYVLYDEAKKWNDAKVISELNGGYLATITNEEEKSLISELIGYGSSSDYFIGAQRVVDDQNIWEWVTGEAFAFTDWNAGEPTNSSGVEDFVGINKSHGKWNDYPNNNYAYIEEHDFIIGHNSDEGRVWKSNSSAWFNDAIQINSLTKTEYFSGDKFDANSAEIYMYDKLISDYGTTFDSSCRGTALAKMGFVKVAKDDCERYIPVHITKTIPLYIEIDNLGKTEFAVGEEFDISGISIGIAYNNGSNKIVGEKDILYSPPNIEYAGQVEEVVITYSESGINYYTSYEIKTVVDVAESIFIQKLPIKLTYKQGDELLIDGLEVYEVRKSGKKELLDNQYLIVDVSPSLCNAGNSIVTIKHPSNSNIVATYSISVETNKNFDHMWDDGTVTTLPTHTTEGTMTYNCTIENCGGVKIETIPTLDGHTFGDWYKLNDEQHQRMCECGETIELAHAWDTGSIEVPATHFTKGEMLYVCTVCNASETRVLEKIETHDFSDWKEFDDTQHVHTCECGVAEYEDHNWNDGEVSVEPTYTSAGVMTFACNDCGEAKTESIPVLEIPADSPFVIVDSKNAVIGNSVTVEVGLKNNPGITSMKINVAYDSELLKLTDVEYNSVMGGVSIKPENIESLDGSVVLYWTDGFVNYTEDGEFATLTFDVSPDAVADTVTAITITYDTEDIYDANESNVAFFCEEGSLKFIDYTRRYQR